jgi:hypothetical protein
MHHMVSILRPDWSAAREESWLNLTQWRALVASAIHLELTDRLNNIDPQDGRLVAEVRPNTAWWRGHPSRVVFVFLWRIGRFEVGAMYPEEDGGTTFALAEFDDALRDRCQTIAAALGAEIEDLVWPRPSDGGGE